LDLRGLVDDASQPSMSICQHLVLGIKVFYEVFPPIVVPFELYLVFDTSLLLEPLILGLFILSLLFEFSLSLLEG
jgi:hypothetical protein